MWVWSTSKPKAMESCVWGQDERIFHLIGCLGCVLSWQWWFKSLIVKAVEIDVKCYSRTTLKCLRICLAPNTIEFSVGNYTCEAVGLRLYAFSCALCEEKLYEVIFSKCFEVMITRGWYLIYYTYFSKIAFWRSHSTGLRVRHKIIQATEFKSCLHLTWYCIFCCLYCLE